MKYQAKIFQLIESKIRHSLPKVCCGTLSTHEEISQSLMDTIDEYFFFSARPFPKKLEPHIFKTLEEIFIFLITEENDTGYLKSFKFNINALAEKISISYPLDGTYDIKISFSESIKLNQENKKKSTIFLGVDFYKKTGHLCLSNAEGIKLLIDLRTKPSLNSKLQSLFSIDLTKS